jgi:hypothetical protein
LGLKSPDFLCKTHICVQIHWEIQKNHSHLSINHCSSHWKIKVLKEREGELQTWGMVLEGLHWTAKDFWSLLTGDKGTTETGEEEGIEGETEF